jgi:hypothetical protein
MPAAGSEQRALARFLAMLARRFVRAQFFWRCIRAAI